MSLGCCFAFSATATAISTTLAEFSFPRTPLPRDFHTTSTDALSPSPPFHLFYFPFRTPKPEARERKPRGPLWIFFPYREFTPCRCLPLHPLSASAHDVLRATQQPLTEVLKKFNPQFVELAACLIAIYTTHSRFILFFSFFLF